MALVLADRVLETTTTAGSGTITLAGAEPGYQSFSAVGNGNQTYYTITADTAWEVGIGTYTASGTTLSRDTVLSSSASGAKVTFPAGVKKVFVTYPSEKSVNFNVSGDITAATGRIINLGAPSLNSDAATKEYVDNMTTAALHVHEAVVLATPASSGRNDTYNNGTAGVSATLTATANGTLTIDSTVAQAAQRVLIKDCDDQAENGIYVVTTVGNGSTAYVMTRASDADTYGEQGAESLDEGSYFFVTGGTSLKGAAFVCNTPGTITFGTTPITFGEFSQAQVYSAGNGISLTATTISLASPVVVSNGGTGLTTTPTNGQLLIGNGTNYTLSTLTAGSGVSITNSAGSITLSATGLGGTVTAVTATGPLASSGGTSPTISIANSTGTGSVVLDQGATISSATITAALSASITTITGTSANITTVTGTTTTFSSGTISQLGATSATVTTLSGTNVTYSSGTVSQLAATSATISTVSGTNATYSNGNFTSATVTTVSGTTATYTSATVTNLNVTSVTLSNLSIASANITTLTGTTFGTTATTHLRATSAEITTLTSSSANITTLTGTTFGTTATTQLRGASAQITTATVTSANITTLSGTTATISGNLGVGTTVLPFKFVAANSGTDGGWIYSSAAISILGLGGYANAGDGAFQIQYNRGTGAITFNGGTRDTPAARMTIDTNGNVTIPNLGSTSANITTLTGTTFGTTATTQLRANSLAISTTGARFDSAGDVYAIRSGGTTGVIFFGSSGTRYLYYDGSNYTMPGANLFVNGVQAVTNSGTWSIGISGNAATVTNGLYTTGNQTIAARTIQQGSQTATLLTATGSLGGLELMSAGSSAAAFMTFHRPAAYASYFGIDTDNNFAVGGWSAGAALASMKVGSFGVGTAASGTAGEIRATNNITAYYSDARLKDFKGKIGDALYKISQLNGYYYTENEKAEEFGFKNKELQVGVSAQEVNAIMPEVIAPAPFDMDAENKSKSGESYMTVRYEKLVPLLIEAIKELKAEVEALKAAK
jgi:hypothetical protein